MPHPTVPPPLLASVQYPTTHNTTLYTNLRCHPTHSKPNQERSAQRTILIYNTVQLQCLHAAAEQPKEDK